MALDVCTGRLLRRVFQIAVDHSERRLLERLHGLTGGEVVKVPEGKRVPFEGIGASLGRASLDLTLLVDHEEHDLPIGLYEDVSHAIVRLAGYVTGTDEGPTDQAREVFDMLRSELEDYQRQMEALSVEDVARFNRLLDDRGIEPIGQN